jgi:hypothetical protein
LLIGIRAAEEVVRQRWANVPGSTILGVLAAATLACIGWTHTVATRYIAEWPEGVPPSFLELARWVRDHTQPGESVAFDQIGVVGYVARRRVIDPMGLVSPEVQRVMHEGDGRWRWVASKRPDWLIASGPELREFSHLEAYRGLQEEASFLIQREGGRDAGRPIRYLVFRPRWP